MRLIDADKLPKYTGYALSASEVAIAVENATTVDAVPVVHATLEDMGLAEDDREWVCSNCKAEFTLCVCGKDRTGYINHCPYCGAMIIGERKGGDE